MGHIHVPEVHQHQSRRELPHDLPCDEKRQFIPGVGRLGAVDVLHQAALERLPDLPVKPPTAAKDGPADPLVAGVEDALKLAQDVFSVGHTLIEVALDDLVHGLQQQLLRQYDIRALALAIAAHLGRAHGGETLVGANRPRIGRARAGGLAKVLEDGWRSGPPKAEVIDALPIPSDNAGSGVVVRQHAVVDTVLKESTFSLEPHQARHIAQALWRERLLIAAAAAEGHDNDLAIRLGRFRWPRPDPRRHELLRDRQSGEFEKVALGQAQHQ